LTGLGVDSGYITGDVGGKAYVSDYFEQPTGTGVFNPFLTIDSKSNGSTGNGFIEQGYNTDGHSNLYLDQQRPQWNNYLKVGDLADITFDSILYYAFILDSNEPGGNKSLISVDNIRIYTSSTDKTGSVGNDITKLGGSTTTEEGLGVLRWAMNDPLFVPPVDPKKPYQSPFDKDQWILLDSSQENVESGSSNSNGGSGKGDMIVYIPQAAFGNAGDDDFVWFYNLNGVHYDADYDFAAEAGFEEWRAVVKSSNAPPPQDGGGAGSVPDGGTTLLALGISLLGLGSMRKLIGAKA